MGILDEAIREHLELKRQHGADDSELQQLEDEAFGPPERPGGSAEAPDPASEAPTEFMAQPDAPDAESAAPPEEPSSRRESSAGILDLQEAPDDTEKAEAAPASEPEQESQAEAVEEAQPQAEEEPQAAEHELVPEPPAQSDFDEPVAEEPEDPAPAPPTAEEPTPPRASSEELPTGPTTEERHAIAEHPTELYDVEQELAAAEPQAPSEEDLAAEEMTAARLGPSDALSDPVGEDPEPAALEEPVAEAVSVDEEDEEFFSEQRLSEELDQALEAPRQEEPLPASEPEAFEEEEAESAEHEMPSAEHQIPSAEHEVPKTEEEPHPSSTADEDVLEETPEFLEGTEDDELWFEQKPPKDFDFDD